MTAKLWYCDYPLWKIKGYDFIVPNGKTKKKLHMTRRFLSQGDFWTGNRRLGVKWEMWSARNAATVALQYGLMSRMMGPFTFNDVAITDIEAMERQFCKYTKRWLGVPNSMTNLVLHSSHTNLTLPVKSLVEEFKVAKEILYGTHQRLQWSSSEEYPAWRQNWKDVVSWEGSGWGQIKVQTQWDDWSCASRTPRIGLDIWWLSANDSERLKLVSKEIREAEEEKRLATAIGQVNSTPETAY